VRRLVDVLDEHATMLRSVTADPAVARLKLEQRVVPDGFAELLEILGGAADSAAMLRARCALGVIYSGVIGGGHAPVPAHRLSEAEKEFVTAAAMAVLAVPTT
jgi:hypothetical protein